jgi:hypothetical protein
MMRHKLESSLAIVTILVLATAFACSDDDDGPPTVPTLDPLAARWPSDEECKDATPAIRQVRTVAPDGEPLTITEAFFPDDPGEPLDLFPFRLLPPGYPDPAIQAPTRQVERDFLETEDASLLPSSRAWFRINHIPVGYEVGPGPLGVLVDGQAARVAWTFESKGAGLGMVWVWRTDARVWPDLLPIDVRVTPCDSSIVIEKTTFHGHPAIVERDRDGGAPNKLTFVSNEIETYLYGDVPLEELFRLAESFDPPIVAATPGQ